MPALPDRVHFRYPKQKTVMVLDASLERELQRGELLAHPFPSELTLAIIFCSGWNQAPNLNPSSPHSLPVHSLSLLGSPRLRGSLSGGNENPDPVELAFPKPADPADYERAYGCPVRFDATRNAVVLSTARLDRTIARITPSLVLEMDRHAERLLAALPKANTQSTRVREQILDALRAGPATPEEVCQRLKVSERTRTLRRRLQEEETTFSELLSQVRKEPAHRYLEDPGGSVTEIAFLLGFADGSAFQRAFRKWFGSSPSENRRTLTAAAARGP